MTKIKNTVKPIPRVYLITITDLQSAYLVNMLSRIDYAKTVGERIALDQIRKKILKARSS